MQWSFVIIKVDKDQLVSNSHKGGVPLSENICDSNRHYFFSCIDFHGGI
ncbi:hypothetical protein EV207_111122 [Scopulibacillus darangshiensis]|uniref:Uncharacterized protein n=1 Tax=Scopulibacillus darangshiensis TaxID=442528 RepID=A0A4R2P547_9BACL|nr:hypothetical protein EV207_111122 [Scopulibacillus darangshiensis]